MSVRSMSFQTSRPRMPVRITGKQEGTKLLLACRRFVGNLARHWTAAEPPKVNPIVFLDRVAPQPYAEYLDNDSYDNPENSSVHGIPPRFLRGCHACCAENDEGACRTYMHELRQQHAFRVRINPCDQHSHGRHGQTERKKKWQPIGTMWGGGGKIVDNRKVPKGPQQPE